MSEIFTTCIESRIYPEASHRFDILESIIEIDNIARIDPESIDDDLIVLFLRFLQSHLCGAKYPIKKVLEMHLLFQILEPIFLLVGRNIALYSIFSQFLYFSDEFDIRLILEFKPCLQIFFWTSFPFPLFEKRYNHFSEIRPTDRTLLKYSCEKWLHAMGIESCSARVFITPHRGLDEDSIGVEEEVCRHL